MEEIIDALAPPPERTPPPEDVAPKPTRALSEAPSTPRAGRRGVKKGCRTHHPQPGAQAGSNLTPIPTLTLKAKCAGGHRLPRRRHLRRRRGLGKGLGLRVRGARAHPRRAPATAAR
eukprot:scaffold35695_cov45-Phaeocystis_antarctica.AAC.1